MNTHRLVRLATLLRRQTAAALAGAILVGGVASPLAAAARDFDPLTKGANPFAAATGWVDKRGEIVVIDDSTVADAKTVSVMPAYVGASGGDAAWLDLALGLQNGKLDAGAAVSAAAAPLDVVTRGTFGFAGQATDADLDVLRISVGLGHILALRGMGDEQGAETIAAELRKQSKLLAVLDADSRSVAAQILQGGGQEMVGVTLGRALTTGLRGIATRERAHGYFVAGVWSGAATLVAARGGNANFAGFAEPMAQMLDKDARFGSHDRQIASAMRAMAKELSSERPDAGAVRKQVATVLAIARG